MVPSISVILPVGPFSDDAKWLSQAVASIEAQTLRPSELIIIDDGSWCDVSKRAIIDAAVRSPIYIDRRIVTNPWRLGCAASWNIGIGLAKSQFCFMMGADDTLEPDCLRQCYMEYSGRRDEYGYYFVTLKYFSDGLEIPYELETQPCNAAMVSRELWFRLGGFTPEMGLGAPDAAMISIMLAHGRKAGSIYPVLPGTPLYNVRMHPGRDTSRQGRYHDVIITVRNRLTEDWKPWPR